MKRFKDPMLQKMYQHFMDRSSVPKEGSSFWEWFWHGYNEDAKKPVPRTLGYAIWRAGKDRRKSDGKTKEAL